MIQDLCIKIAHPRGESVANAGRITLASSETGIKASNVLWRSERSLTGFRDAVLWVSVSSSSDNRRVTGTRVAGLCGGGSSSISPCIFLGTGWVAVSRRSGWHVRASKVIGDETSNRRDRRGRDREELASINIVDEAE